MGKIIDKVKGKLMKAEGKVTGDKVRQAQGSLEDTKGDIKGGIDKVKDGVKSAASKVSSTVRDIKDKASRKTSAARRTR